jgi:hypothetical protein
MLSRIETMMEVIDGIVVNLANTGATVTMIEVIVMATTMTTAE